jgi:Xaa-Pro aminopeptidase
LPPTKAAAPSISDREYTQRREAVAAGLEAARLDALCVFYPTRVAWLTGFHHIPTERPITAILDRDGFCTLVVPAVEKEHAESVPGVDRVDVYFEYPGERHPMQTVKDALAQIHARRVAADHDGYIEYWGYRGPRLTDVLGSRPADGEMLIETLRRVKSKAEIECMEVSAGWAARAHHEMQNAIRPGKTEIECYEEPAARTLQRMIAEMPGWRPRRFAGSGLTCMFVGGKKTAMPHGFVRGHGLQPGDVLVSGAGADIDGYSSELERTMIIGEPAPEQRSAFAAMVAMQDRAFEVMKPGMPMGQVELEVAAVAAELGHDGHLRHHVGHSVGLEVHEAPFLDRGETDPLEPGMVFTVEPGLYLPEVGGFRHSDTVVITEEGCRLLTEYPRDLDSLVVPG